MILLFVPILRLFYWTNAQVVCVLIEISRQKMEVGELVCDLRFIVQGVNSNPTNVASKPLI